MSGVTCSFVDENVATWGQCLTDTVFFGDPNLMAIVVIGFYAVFMYKANLPGALALPIAALLSLGLYLNGSTVFGAVYFVILLLTFGYIALVVYNRFKGS
jgi:membrane-bound ClpP family serine protease